VRVAAAPAIPVAADLPLALGGCPTVGARKTYERTDCLQATRVALLEGQITLTEALRRLESCAASREDLRPMVADRAEARADAYRARVAFGELLTAAEVEEYTGLVAQLDRSMELPSPEAVERLRAAGLTPAGIA